MKQSYINIIVVITLGLCMISLFSCTMLRKNNPPPLNIVVDQSSNPSLQNVIRRVPTITSTHRVSPIASPVGTQTMSFSNTNDNNGIDITPNELGKSAEIVGPAIYVHGKGTLSALHETPAQIGWRNEKTVLTSLNKQTSIIFL